MEHLQELYTVAVGLAMTIAVERVLPAEAQGDVLGHVVVVFAAFITTLIPFYHGAQRHLDLTYRFYGKRKPPQNLIFFGDFVFLFLEACLLIGMGASVENSVRFMALWLGLLSLDVIWLLVFVLSVPREVDEKPAHPVTRYGWAVINVPSILLGALLLPWLDSAEEGSLCGATLVLVVALLRTAGDYAWNWRTYFPRRASSAGTELSEVPPTLSQ